jgi:outer membrane murein-binding lipoprotein Lpp
MNADDRLNQLEPLVSEALTVLDRHTLQLKQLNAAVGQLSTAVAQQGDNISFLLREQLAMKADVAEIKSDVAVLKADVAGIKNEVAGIKNEMAGMNGKLDLLVQLIQQPKK